MPQRSSFVLLLVLFCSLHCSCHKNFEDVYILIVSSCSVSMTPLLLPLSPAEGHNAGNMLGTLLSLVLQRFSAQLGRAALSSSRPVVVALLW